jgi:hypothetical protein
MNPDHQSCALALHLGAFIREKRYGGELHSVLTFVKPTSPAPFTYGLKLIEPYYVNGIKLIDAIASDVPNYPESLDALFPVEEKLFYKDETKEVVEKRGHYLRLLTYNTNHPIHATAAEKLEMILRTINLYDAKTVEGD